MAVSLVRSGRQEVRVVRVDLEAHDHAVAVERQRGVVDVEVAVLRETRMEGDSVQALLDEPGLHIVAERIDVGQVEERLQLDRAVRRHRHDAADPLDDEDPSRAVAGVGDVDRVAEAVGDLDQRDLRIARQIAPGSGHVVRNARHLLRQRRYHQSDAGDGAHHGRSSSHAILPPVQASSVSSASGLLRAPAALPVRNAVLILPMPLTSIRPRGSNS